MQTLQQLRSGQLSGARSIKISAGLTSFPPELLDLAATLEVLDLSGNQLTALPPEFSRLQQLKVLFLSDNLFTAFPGVIGQCKALDIVGFKANKISHIAETALPPNLRWLILTDNCITALPASVGHCPRLQKLMLAGNQLQSLPDTLANCTALELLRISANKLQEIPAWLFTMPRLAWLAFAGNPCSTATVTDTLPEIPWQQLTITHQLGEGASGIISKANRIDEHGNFSEVAVKVFKGHVTSDGLPEDELNACIAAGKHPDIVAVSGRVTDHPSARQGLVLKLIPPAYYNLGGPPSLQTCTRDTYPAGTAFTVTEIIRISLAVASAAAHLHDRGVLHGDLYAHNILTDAEGHLLLGDFGAATIYDRVHHKTGGGPEHIEVRAFGCLLDDLLTHHHAEEQQPDVIVRMTALRDECLSVHVTDRPGFRSIHTAIRALAAAQPA